MLFMILNQLYFWLFLEGGGGNGLKGLYSVIRDNWIGPAFLLVVAVFAIVFVKNRQFRELVAFVGICIIVALLVFLGAWLFGGGDEGDGKLTEAAKKVVDQINTINPQNALKYQNTIFSNLLN